MTCEQARKLLAPFIGGQLDAGRHRAVELHVEHCAVCAKELADLRATIEALHSLDPIPVPAGFVERVRSRVETRAGARFRLWAWAAPIGAVAALALGLGVLGHVVQLRETAPVIVAERSPDAAREPSDTTLKKAPARGPTAPKPDKRAVHVKTEPPRSTATSPIAPDKARRPGGGLDRGVGTPTESGVRSFGAVAPSGADRADSRPRQETAQPPQQKAEPVIPETVQPTRPPTLPPVSGTGKAGHLAESPRPAPPDGQRPSIEDLRTDTREQYYGAVDYSVATAGQRANWWARSKSAQSQLVLLAKNSLDEARAQARQAAENAPIVVTALAAQPAPDHTAALSLNVQSMRPVANAEITLANVAPLPTPNMAGTVLHDQAGSRILWRGTLAESDVKTILLASAAPAAFAQRADIQVAATEPASREKQTAAKALPSEVVNFALFVPPDVGKARPATKASFAYVRQPLDVVFGDLSARSGLALLVRDPYGRIVDFRTPVVTGQQAVRLLAEQQGYHVIPDAIAWTLY